MTAKVGTLAEAACPYGQTPRSAWSRSPAKNARASTTSCTKSNPILTTLTATFNIKQTLRHLCPSYTQIAAPANSSTSSPSG